MSPSHYDRIGEICRRYIFQLTTNNLKQIQVKQYGGPEVLQIADVEKPQLDHWEVLVRVQYASANPKDVLLRNGKLKAYLSIAFPLTLGQDCSGIVEDVGKKVKEFKKGDRVFGMTNRHNNGTFSELVKFTPNEICLMPGNLSFAEAASVPLTAQTALQALKDIARLQPGQRVCINGASGGVGIFAVQIAKIIGANVTAVSSEANKDLCLRLGADRHIDYQGFSFAQWQENFDVFFDVFGNQSWRKTRHLLAGKGWYITTVPNARNIGDTLLSYVRLRKSRLVVVESHAEDLAQIKEWLENGRLQTIIEATYPMERLAEAHRRLETKRTVGKIVINVAGNAKV